jgi:hypothetical protein
MWRSANWRAMIRACCATSKARSVWHIGFQQAGLSQFGQEASGFRPADHLFQTGQGILEPALPEADSTQYHVRGDQRSVAARAGLPEFDRVKRIVVLPEPFQGLDQRLEGGILEDVAGWTAADRAQIVDDAAAEPGYLLVVQGLFGNPDIIEQQPGLAQNRFNRGIG